MTNDILNISEIVEGMTDFEKKLVLLSDCSNYWTSPPSVISIPFGVSMDLVSYLPAANSLVQKGLGVITKHPWFKDMYTNTALGLKVREYLVSDQHDI